MTAHPLYRAITRGVLAALMVTLAACSSLKDPEIQGSAEELYASGKSEMSSGNWPSAIKYLEKVEGRAGGGLLAQQSQLDLSYAYWKSGEKAQAISTLDRFIKLNPSSPGLDYALYLRGMVVDFSDRMIGGGFKFSNPNAKASCSCGESFSL